jgi:hypothetical protein
MQPSPFKYRNLTSLVLNPATLGKRPIATSPTDRADARCGIQNRLASVKLEKCSWTYPLTVTRLFASGHIVPYPMAALRPRRFSSHHAPSHAFQCPPLCQINMSVLGDCLTIAVESVYPRSELKQGKAITSAFAGNR